MIHLEVPVSAGHKGIIDLEIFCEDYACAAHHPDGNAEERFGSCVWDGLK